MSALILIWKKNNGEDLYKQSKKFCNLKNKIKLDFWHNVKPLNLLIKNEHDVQYLKAIQCFSKFEKSFSTIEKN